MPQETSGIFLDHVRLELGESLIHMWVGAGVNKADDYRIGNSDTRITMGLGTPDSSEHCPAKRKTSKAHLS